jgi:hypothetical protein
MVQTKLHPDVEKQAKVLSERTDITESQAEAFLLWMRSDSETKDASLASQLGISRSAFSQRLSGAKRVLGMDKDSNNMHSGEGRDSEQTLDAVSQFLVKTNIGGVNEYAWNPIDGLVSRKVVASLREYAFESGTNQFRLTIFFNDTPRGEYMEEMPDEMHLPARWTTITVEGETLTELATFAEAICKQEEFSDFQNLALANLFNRHNVDVSGWILNLDSTNDEA